MSQSGASTLNEYKGVITDYTEAINLDSNTPVSYYQRGILVAKVGRTHEAVLDLEQALQIAEAVGNEQMINRIQQKLHEIKQAARQSHSNGAGGDSENEINSISMIIYQSCAGCTTRL